jgi:hypothetical protein
MPSSLLGSWIDLEAAASVARDLCPPELLPPQTAGADPAGDEPLAPGDLKLIHPYEEEAGDAPPSPPGRSGQIHARLTEIKDRATKTGLISGSVEAAEPEASGPRVSAGGRAAETGPDSGVGRGLQVAPDSAAPLRLFVPPLGPLNLRARALGDWLRETFSPSALFVSDAQGRALVEFDAPGDLIAGAIVLVDAALKARRHLPANEAISGVLHIELAPSSILSLVTTHTKVGLLHAGLAGHEPLSADASRLIARALRKTVETEN